MAMAAISSTTTPATSQVLARTLRALVGLTPCTSQTFVLYSSSILGAEASENLTDLRLVAYRVCGFDEGELGIFLVVGVAESSSRLGVDAESSPLGAAGALSRG
jgi:hypothetical protein